MIRRLGLALSIVLVVVIAGGIISWAVETPAEQIDQKLADRRQAQLNHKLQLKPPPDYTINTDTIDSSAYPCDTGVDTCMVVYTEGDYDTKELASITRSILSDPSYPTGATSIQFADGVSMADTGTSYCFPSKDHLVRTLGKISLDEAQLVGKIKNCYLAIYDAGFEPELKTR